MTPVVQWPQAHNANLCPIQHTLLPFSVTPQLQQCLLLWSPMGCGRRAKLATTSKQNIALSLFHSKAEAPSCQTQE